MVLLARGCFETIFLNVHPDFWGNDSQFDVRIVFKWAWNGNMETFWMIEDLDKDVISTGSLG